ncbi:hypothetical protein SAMN04490244_104228 [Tranquillimonas rosea]|uniref:Uncharacterized protein n=1 Tax=Tranquillimonas rosea TaxID=641238 RepID=A0A1H9TJU0_9RHOB|nr:hypothetical protein [Tranquillimonas rosea]SER97411.1 hypothetical protein SAMN04490244_104228 [Tranquillimonas rosea]
MSLSPVWRLAAAAFAGLLLGFLGAILWIGPNQDRFDFLYEDFTIESCLSDRLDPMPASPGAARTDVLACYDKLVLQGQLNEFQVRRVNFQNQHTADTVTLWMVVTLTLCGVALAGFQIATSSRLVATKPEALSTEISVENGKLFVRSSVTGLLILLVSFAFFYVYVAYIYRLEEWSDEAEPVSASDPAPVDVTGPLLEGGFGLVE